MPTAAAIVLINAVLALGVGCSFYLLRGLYAKLTRPEQPAPEAKSSRRRRQWLLQANEAASGSRSLHSGIAADPQVL